jgi:hypothetical protein
VGDAQSADGVLPSDRGAPVGGVAGDGQTAHGAGRADPIDSGPG